MTVFNTHFDCQKIRFYKTKKNLLKVCLFRDLGIGADTQGDEYQFAYTLPSQSQVEDSFSKLIIKETNENNNLEDRELQFEVH